MATSWVARQFAKNTERRSWSRTDDVEVVVWRGLRLRARLSSAPSLRRDKHPRVGMADAPDRARHGADRGRREDLHVQPDRRLECDASDRPLERARNPPVPACRAT